MSKKPFVAPINLGMVSSKSIDAYLELLDRELWPPPRYPKRPNSLATHRYPVRGTRRRRR